MEWMSTVNILDRSGRESITHNIVQIGESNKLLTDLPDVANAFKQAIYQHNDNSMHYKCDLAVNESYLELAYVVAIYAAHEVSNCIYHSIYLIYYNLH